MTVPNDATQLNVTLYGASGTDGQSASDFGIVTPGGHGGFGAAVNGQFTLSTSGLAAPGHTLLVVVPKAGEAGAGGAQNSVNMGGTGGSGGGAAILRDTSAPGAPDIVVAGGGGGGAGAGNIPGLTGGKGGNGGSDGGSGGGAGGSGGTGGQGVTCTTAGMYGTAGASVTYWQSGGSGGGGGDGWCGGQGGADGGYGSGGGGGGGGGGSYTDPALGASINSVAPASLDGDVGLTFTTQDTTPQITSANATGLLHAGSLNFAVTATGFPAPRYSITGAPSWVSIYPATGQLHGIAPASAHGKYRFTVIATNPDQPSLQATQQFTLNVFPAPTG